MIEGDAKAVDDYLAWKSPRCGSTEIHNSDTDVVCDASLARIVYHAADAAR